MTARAWVLASSNAGKLAEYRELLSATPIRLDPLDPSTSDLPPEMGLSFVENALIKARHAAGRSGKPAIADDSGLCVAALGGAPGVRSARYAGAGADDDSNVARLLAELEGIAESERTAAFHCVIVALEAPDDPVPVVAHGCWRGRIAFAPKGENGFGYDPIFFDPALRRTAAELSSGEKNAVSHRFQAASELKRLLGC